MELEIKQSLNLSEQELQLLDTHSFLNILNVLSGEIYIASTYFATKNLLQAALDKIQIVAAVLIYKDKFIEQLQKVDVCEHFVQETIETACQQQPDYDVDKLNQSKENIASIFAVFEIRAREYLSRANTPERWVLHGVPDLTNLYINVLKAIELNSHGRYRILFNIAQQRDTDYFVCLKIDSYNHKMIFMPPVIQDVFRDLIANARKYTPVGGKIEAGIYESHNSLHLVVEDNGCGIPEHQVEKVAQFGFRADNVLEHSTKGGGFGLTKAFFVTKQFNGRMWIKSVLNKGTRISICIPIPQLKTPNYA